MRRRTALSLALGWIALIACSAAAWADARRLADEQAVSVAQIRQRNPVVSVREDGRGWVVWENQRQGIVGRRLDRDGRPVGDEIVLVTNINLPSIPDRGEVLWQQEPALAVLPGGGFLLVWSAERVFLTLDIFYERRDRLDKLAYAQFFDESGRPDGRRFRVDPDAAFAQGSPRVAIGEAFAAIVWQEAVSATGAQERGILRGRFFDIASGQGGRPVRIAGPKSEFPTLAVDRADNLWVAWQGQDASGDGVFVRRFRANGRALGGAVQVNDTVTGCQRRPSLAPRSGGGFWLFFHGPGATEKEYLIYARRLSADGTAVGVDQAVSAGNHEVEIYPAAATIGNGRYVVLWMAWFKNMPQGFYARELREEGGTLAAVGESARINEFRAYTQFRTAVAASNGHVTAVWESLQVRQRQAGVSAVVFSGAD